jgi:hypothetical protein
LFEHELGDREFQLLFFGCGKRNFQILVMERELEAEWVLIGKHGG